MVDSVNNSSGSQNLNRVDLKASNKPKEKEEAEKTGGSVPVDEVSLSNEAISLAEAEASAKKVRTILEQQAEETLSGEDGNKFDTLL